MAAPGDVPSMAAPVDPPSKAAPVDAPSMAAPVDAPPKASIGPGLYSEIGKKARGQHERFPFCVTFEGFVGFWRLILLNLAFLID